MKEVIVGYVIWYDKENKPYRPIHGTGWRAQKMPPRIYTSEKRAGPGAVPVYVKVEDVNNENSDILESL